MNTKNTRPLIPLGLLSLCLLFLGINGFMGGYEMLREPNGAPLGMPVSFLERTPFENYFVPGLLLIFLWGGGSFLTLIALWWHSQWPGLNRLAWGLSVVLGLGLIIWLTVQVFTLPAIAPIQFILYGLAAFLIGLPLLPPMRRYYGIA